MKKVFEIYIKTTPARLWNAITDTEMRRKYNSVPSSLRIGRHRPLRGRRRRDGPIFRAKIWRSIRAPAGTEFRALWGEDVKTEGTSRVTWEIEPIGDSCLLKVTHDQLREGATISCSAAGR